MQGFSTFRGYIKQADLSRMNGGAAALVTSAFPHFFTGAKWNEADQHLVQMLQLGNGRAPDRYRRFSGCLRGLSPLSSNRYFSVCLDESGDDGGTLANELLAYSNLSKGSAASVLDLFDIEVAVLLNKLETEHSICLVTLDLPKQPKGLLQSFLRRIRPSLLPVRVMSLPYMVEQVEISDVVDLRLPSTRHWFWQYFRSGDGRFFRMLPDTHIGCDTFYTLWPTLCDFKTGGNWVTDAIGAALRELGASGIVYPSARMNHFVEISEGEVVNFSGWNFLDYRGAPKSQPVGSVQVESSYEGPWESIFLPGVKLTIAPEDSSEAGSYWVAGLSEALDALRDLKWEVFERTLIPRDFVPYALIKSFHKADTAGKAALLGLLLEAQEAQHQ